MKAANFLDISHHGDCLQWEMNIYLVCSLLYGVYCIILRSVSVKLADIVQCCQR